MTWIKLDDTVTEHPSYAHLSPFAWTLWLHGLTYCSRNLTDGHIPRAMLSRLSAIDDPASAAEELVEAGRWHVTRDGWDVHDYLDHQRSAAEVDADREAAKERQRKARERRKAAKEAKEPPVTGMSQRDNGVSHGDVTAQETETETDSSSSEDEELAAAHLESHIQHQGDRITSPAGLRRSELPRMLHTIAEARQLGVDPVDALESRWETKLAGQSFDLADYAPGPVVPPLPVVDAWDVSDPEDGPPVVRPREQATA